jgi:membrane protease YdiL (CAAX protease family)
MAATPTLQPASARDRLGPASRADGWRWLLIALAGAVAGLVLSLVFTSIAALIAGTPGGARTLANEASPPVWFVACELVGLWCGFALAAVAVTRSGRSVGLTVHPRDAWYLLVGMGLQLVVDAVYLPFHLHGLTKSNNSLLGGGSSWLLLVPAVLTICFAPFFEELFFRGVVLRGLVAAWRTQPAALGVAAAVLVDATLFGLAHLGTDAWYQLPGLVALGVILCVLAIRSGRLGPSILTHAGFNLLAVVLYAGTR